VISEVFETRRILALFLPWLSAERVIRASAALRDTAFALIEHQGGAMRVVAVSPAAAGRGLIGLTLADARVREPDLITVKHDPIADAALLEWLADDCERYSPTVAVDPPAGIVIDVTGCRSCDSQGKLPEAVSRRFAQHGITAATAEANTVDAAAALARCAGGATVSALPIIALRIDAMTRIALRRAGLVTIGALAAIPRAQLAARFGEHVPTLLARLFGEVDAPLTPRRPPPAIAVEHRFADPVAVTAAILRTLDKLVRSAATMLEQSGAGGRRFETTLFRSDGHVARLAIDTAGPTRDPHVIARLIAERIAALSDPLDPGFGYDLIRFAVFHTEPLDALQLALDGGGIADQQVAALIDRLTTRLGSGRIRRLARGDSHIPEQASFDLPTIVKQVWPMAERGEPPLRPLSLLVPPQRIEVMAAVPDGPPLWFRWRRIRHDVGRVEGPERFAAEWWRRPDGRGLTRDYYRVEDENGRRFWVFRQGQYGVEQAHPNWYLHGLFP